MEFPRSHCGILDLVIARKYVYESMSDRHPSRFHAAVYFFFLLRNIT